MIELRDGPGGSLSSGFAGDTLNTATYLRRLLPAERFEVSYVTAVGDDRLSARMLAAWRAEGIATELVQRRRGELPGVYWIHTDDAGEREFLYWRSASAARAVLADGHAGRVGAALQAGDVVYLTGISLAILSPDDRRLLMGLLSGLRERGVGIVYDGNFRPRLWPSLDDAREAQRRVLQVADTFITSHADESAMFGDPDIAATAERLQSLKVPEWVLRGEPGETIASGAGHARGFFVDTGEVVDTTGAGDSFDAAFLAARLCGHEMSRSIRAGHALASIVVRHHGAIIAREETPPLPTLLAG